MKLNLECILSFRYLDIMLESLALRRGSEFCLVGAAWPMLSPFPPVHSIP